MDKEYLDEEAMEAFDALMEQLRNLPENIPLRINKPRYTRALSSINRIINYVKSDYPEAETEVSFDELFGTMLNLRIITDDICIRDIRGFCRAIEAADNMGINARIDGTFEIDFGYQDVKTLDFPCEKRH